MTSDFTLLAEHMQTVLGLPEASREGYLASLPEEIARQLRELLPFQNATFDLSQVPAVEMALDVLAQPQPEFVGRWRVQRLLGRGGMASVYLVERSDGAIRQLAACKIGYARTELEDGLRRETATLLDLAHPGIAHVLDFGHTGGRPWLVSEFIEGADIVSWANEKRLPLAARLERFEAVLAAVAYAHERLLLHQDIKPGNVLVDAAGHPRLIDFGLATVLSGRGDSPVTGYTPRYASPEQKRGEALTVRSDIYSLGVTLEALLEGVGPARGSADARAVIEKACREDPAERYASAADMAADLRAIRELRPIKARNHSAGYRLKRFLQRHPLPITLAAVIVLSIIAGVGATAWQAQRATDAARTAEAALVNAQAVETFLIEDVLGRANPADAQYDPALGIVGVLDQAGKAVERRFGSNPLAAAGIHAALASIQRNLGRFDEAVHHAERAAALYAAELGPAHDLTLASRYAKARTLASLRLDEAEAELAAIDAIAAERLHQDTRLALDAAIARATLEQHRIKGPTALAAFTRLAQLQARIAPEDRALAATAAGGRAEALLRMERYPEAIAVLETLPLDAYAGMPLAEIHRKLAWAYRDLTVADNQAQGVKNRPEQFDRALAHAERATALFREHLGNDAHATLASLGTLSRIHELRGDCEKALTFGREAFDGMRRVYGQTASGTLIERGNLGIKQFECGQEEPGMANLLAAIDGLAGLHGQGNLSVQNFTQTSTWLLTRIGRYNEAMDRFDTLTDAALLEDDLLEVIRMVQEGLVGSGGSQAQRQRAEAVRARMLALREAASRE